MKKVLFVVLILICALSLFAVGNSATVNLSKGTSTNSDVSVSYTEDGNLQITYKGTSSIDITLTGKITHTVIVKSDKADYTLSLNGVEITGNELPALQLKSETTCTLYLTRFSKNTISDSSSNSKKGAITSSGNIIIDGPGNLTLNVFKKHGFKLDGGLTIKGGNVSIVGDSKAEGNMISADVFFVMDGGNLTINASGNVYGSESKAIKVNGVEGKTEKCGYIEINDGSIDITSVGKAISAGWKAEEDGTTETLEDDPIPDVYINGGSINIKTSGVPREDTYTNGVCNDDGLSPEGIEAKHNLYFNGGTVYVYSTDDCVNAGNMIQVNGGYLYLASSDNDSFDSNGTIEINGGTVITYSSSWEQAFDCDNDANFTYTGGTFVGLGNGNNIPASTGTTGYSIAYGNKKYKAGDQIIVLDSNNKIVIGFEVPASCNNVGSVVFGSELIKQGQTYKLVLGKSSKVGKDGLITSGSCTISEELFTVTMNTYSASEGYIGMNVGGGFGGPGFNDMGRFGAMNGMNTKAELPSKITINGELTTDEALSAIQYIIQNYLGGMTPDNEPFMGGNPPEIPQGNQGGMPGEMPGGMPGGIPGGRR